MLFHPRSSISGGDGTRLWGCSSEVMLGRSGQEALVVSGETGSGVELGGGELGWRLRAVEAMGGANGGRRAGLVRKAGLRWPFIGGQRGREGDLGCGQLERELPGGGLGQGTDCRQRGLGDGVGGVASRGAGGEGERRAARAGADGTCSSGCYCWEKS